MGFFSFLSPKKDVQTTTVEPEEKRAQVTFSNDLVGVLTGANTSAEKALKISAVWACVRILSNTSAIPSLNVYEKQEDDKVSTNYNHEVYRLLNVAPNEYMTPFIFKLTMVTNLYLHGNAYARILRSNGSPVALIPIANSDVQVKQVNHKVFYQISGLSKMIPARDMLHFKLFSENGITGRNPLKVAADMFFGNSALQEFSNMFFANGANIGGVIEAPGKVSETAYKNLKESWKNKYTGVANSHKPAILEQGMSYKPIATNPEQQQLLQSREFGVEEISRFYGVPSHMINSLNKATLNNIEHLSIQFVRYTMQPLFENMEQEYTSKLISEADKVTTFVKHDIDELLRGDMKARAEYNRTGINFGYLTINEARKREGLNPIEGGDTMMIQANMTSLENVLKNGPDHSAPDTKNMEE